MRSDEGLMRGMKSEMIAEVSSCDSNPLRLLQPLKAHNRRRSSLINGNNWPTRSGSRRRRRLSAIRIRDNSRSLKRIRATMQARWLVFPGRGGGEEEGWEGKEIGRREIGRDGVEIHFLNGGWGTIYLTDGD